MKNWLGHKLLEMGLRLLGFKPTQHVVFASAAWDAKSAATWAGQIVMGIPPTFPSDITIVCWDEDTVSAIFSEHAAETVPCPSPSAAPARS